MSVAEVLALPVVRRARPQVLAGDGALDRRVRWAHVFDLTEIRGLLHGGELILSTGAPLSLEPARLQRFVDELDDQGAAALAVEIGGTFATQLPQPLIDRARQRSLPLIAFRRQVRFVDITEAIHRALVDRDNDLLRRGQPIHRRIESIAVNGGGVQELIDELASLLGSPVIIEDLSGELVALASAHVAADQTMSALRGPRSSNDGAGVVSVDISRSGARWGRLVASELDTSLDFPIAKGAAERAALMISLCLARDRQDSVVRAHTRGAFLDDLRTGRLTEQTAERRAAAFGSARASHELIPLVLAWRGAAGDWTPVLGRFEKLSRLDRPLLVGQVGPDLVVVVAVSDPRRTERTIQAVYAAGSSSRSPTEFGSITAARGAVSANWNELGEQLRSVAIAAHYAPTTDRQTWVDARVPEADWVLHEVADRAELRRYADRILSPLVSYDRNHGTELLRTLAVYLECSRSKTEAANRLHLQRQSLYGRLDRIREVLGIDLADHNVAFAVELAVRLRKISDDQRGHPPRPLT